ncbi:ferredoxin--NADP(+) reductase [Paramagnetospirillum marisnigri]|uniref:Ferredoxin--NADP reductase n=1 Tax=Paramagnetospirillum marisnigri TaxID=1285242 RepID=A0A178MQ73_9PROT|nr:NAD(P)/FAD-dependent oxidoreductase [Paramagnetospirillum marisnigri]OAN50187.1 ferredoxin--NADP(+) reductase [Paramagnetospirillum marisnigri]
MTIHQTDAVVIGAGPAGLFSVFQCGMVKLRCHVVDALEAVGGQLSALYPEKPIYDIPGHPKVLAADLVDGLAEQAAPFAPVYHFGVQVDSLAREADGRWRCGLSNGESILAPVVIIAAGGGAFGPNRPPLEGLDRFEGSSVFYLVRRREDFRDKRVVIAGGGDSAVDWAISLSEVAAKVMVVHRRPKFRAAPESEARLKQLAESGTIDLVVPYQLHGLEGEGATLSAVVVADLEGATKRLEADCLLPFYGLSTNLGPIADWGLTMDRHVIAVDPASCATSAPGVYAVGDICTYPGKLKLILSGFAEAARAAHSAHGVVHPGEALHFEHSTTSGVPARG